MTESTCLHIQDRESGPIRVVELAWMSVRIGRAPYCEVRLTGPDVPAELCRLQRRGQSWRILPSSSASPVLLEGRRLGSPCVVPFGIAFRAGEYCFTIRYNHSAEPDWELYAGPAPPREDTIEKPPVAELEPDPASPLHNLPLPTVRCPRINAEPLVVEKTPEPKPWTAPVPPSRERWETRWKALGAQVLSRAERKRKTPEVSRPLYQSDLQPIPLREVRVPLIQVPAVPRPSQEPQQDAVKLPQPLIEDAQTGFEPSQIIHPETPGFEPWSPVESLAPEPFTQQVEFPLSSSPPHPIPDDREQLSIPAEESTVCILPAEAEPDDPDLEQPFILTEESTVRLSRTDAEPADPDLEQRFIPAEELTVCHSPAAADQADSYPEQSLISTEESTVCHSPANAEPHDLAPKAAHVLIDQPEAKIMPAPVITDERQFEPLPPPKLPPAKDLEWPSAKDILATCRAPSPNRLATNRARKAAKRISRSDVMPTVEHAPSQWTLPISVAGPVAGLFILSAGLLGIGLSWSWAQDSYTASIVTDRLLTLDRAAQRSPLPDSVQPPAGGWITSTPAHLANWAVFLGRFAAQENQSPDESLALLERALAASPINAQARFALAQLEPADNAKPPSIRSLGLSRDAVSLAWSARRLLAAGKKDDALKLMGRALAVAVPDRASRFRVPHFSEDPAVRRYWLPGEEQARVIVADLVSQSVWTFEEWSRVLPESPLVLITAARLLREQDRREAETVLDRILKEQAIPLDPHDVEPLVLAACAEACALRSRFKESGQFYRQAIETMDDPTIRRSWWFNLADIAYRSDDEIERQAALRFATAVAFSDDITRRATDIQRATITRSTGVKAN